jgi:threonine dehydratase
VLIVSDDEILATMRFMLFRMKLLVEPSGAAAAAAVFHRKVPNGSRKVGVVLSGGNVDPEVLTRVLKEEGGN